MNLVRRFQTRPGIMRRFNPVPALVIIIASVLTRQTMAVAQSCDALPVDNSQYRYMFRNNAPRCEGMYQSPVGGYPGMTLVSLTIGKVVYDMKRDGYLEIRLPIKPTEKTSVRALGIPERLYYRLDISLEPGQSVFKLPLDDVLAHENIAQETLGIYATRKLTNGKYAFLPVHARAPNLAAQAIIFAVVRPGADVSDVQWRQYAPGVAPTDWMPIGGASGLVPEGMPLEIALGADIPAETTLEVSYLSQGVGLADKFLLLGR